jgi:hypothetical protein
VNLFTENMLVESNRGFYYNKVNFNFPGFHGVPSAGSAK